MFRFYKKSFFLLKEFTLENENEKGIKIIKFWLNYKYIYIFRKEKKNERFNLKKVFLYKH